MLCSGVLVGAASVKYWEWIHPDTLEIMFVDYSECDALSAKIDFDDFVLSVNEFPEIGEDGPIISIYVGQERPVSYKLEIEFANCDPLITEPRIVEFGRSFYETIDDGDVKHVHRG